MSSPSAKTMYWVHWDFSGSMSIQASGEKQAFTLVAEAFVREGNYFGEGRKWGGKVAPCAGGQLIHFTCNLSHSAPFVSNVEAR